MYTQVTFFNHPYGLQIFLINLSDTKEVREFPDKKMGDIL